MFGMSLRDKANFFRQLATLIESGMPFMGCLEALAKSPSAKVRKVVNSITPLVRDGQSLSDALAQFPGYFDTMVIMMVKAGEVGGQLEVRLKNIAAYLERMYNLQQQTLSKLIYPIVLIHAGIFIPPLVLIFTECIGAYLKATLIPLAILYATVFSLVFLYRTISSIPGIREGVDAVFLYFPILGGFFRARSVYRFMLVLADLSEAGIDLDLSVKTAAGACGNAMARSKFLTIAPCIQGGQPFTACLKRTGMFPDMCLQMIHSGEQSGNLPFMLGKSAELLGQDLERTTNIVFTILPVVLYLVIAGYMGYRIITTFAKIYAPLNDLFPK
ncbi:MAG: type II secretion system F family protein [Candidatus Eremiobacteraeota bacterium]|nr:type II secretion system F family protein [Candidatus Eremiobacteraeota bacterium]